jgi:hypothetical protein
VQGDAEKGSADHIETLALSPTASVAANGMS